MLQERLAALERRCRVEAPSVVDEVRSLRVFATQLSSLLTDSAVSLDGDDLVRPGDAATEAETIATAAGTARYRDLGPLGSGGMGEVRRVQDCELNRPVAMKFIHAHAAASRTVVARFVEELQTTAQLQHPNIVPVYDAGRLADGRVYFTMKEVRGRTFGEVIREVHEASAERWERSPSGWTFRRLVSALHQASQALGYAHARNVVHRDLKPLNVMVGDHGEVQVMDWGLCKVLGRAESATEAVVLERSRDATRMGAVMGTPAYMAPEQARGDIDAIDARTDVYALGAMLYEVLTGRAPYTGRTGEAVVRAVLAGPPAAPRRATGSSGAMLEGAAAETVKGPPDLASERGAPWLEPAGPGGDELALPDELVAACAKAMAREPNDRFPSALAFGAELEAWLDGSKRRERALEIVAQAEAALPEAEALREQAAALRAEATAELADVPSWESEEKKLAGWTKQDEAAAIEVQAALKSLQRDQLLAASLTYVPDLPEAHAALAEDQHGRHLVAEAARDTTAMTRAETLMRAHLEALPERHPVRQRCATYLRGDGALTLVTDPPGADVELLRYERYGRRLVARPFRELGRTPLVEQTLEKGSYLCRVRHPDRAEVRYPVHIGRGAHWHGVRPGDRDPAPIYLPAPGELGPEDCYVPAGWYQAGGRTEYGVLPFGTRLWCDAFVMRRFPVTNREYLVFLHDLVDRGREEEALEYAPRERAGTQGQPGALVYSRDADGRFALRPDAQGDVWDPDWPVLQVDWWCATAYGRWWAERTQQPWRLPWDLEWEKAARGVDGRASVWGDAFDPSFSNMRESHAGRPLPTVVDSFPVDESVYGVRGLAGNVQDWCVDVWNFAGPPLGDHVVRPFEDEGELPGRAQRVNRGGVWLGIPGYARAASRGDDVPNVRNAVVGFRLARGLARGPVPER